METLNSVVRASARYWWVPLVTGILSILLGVATFVWPLASIDVLAVLFAACIFVAGIMNIVYSIANYRTANWGWQLALGLLELFCGAWLLWLPDAVLIQAFIFTVGVMLIIFAINSICESLAFAGKSTGWTVWNVLLLVFTIIFAFIFLFNPIAGGVAVWLWIALSFITFGIFRISMAFAVRKLK